MKILFLIFVFSNQLYSKDIFNYTCPIDKDKKVEISFLDKTKPSVGLFYKNSKFANCLFDNTQMSRPADRKSVSNQEIWQLKLIECTYYFENHKSKIEVATGPFFKRDLEKGGSYFSILNHSQPLACKAKK